ncbi:MAG: hypothetical protein RLZZ340_162 [Actinomycetota bacterium]|jgi:hypothetical protein
MDNKVVTQAIENALLYIDLLNRGNYFPSAQEVDAFITSVQPDDFTKSSAMYANLLSNLNLGIFSQITNPPKPVSAYLRRSMLVIADENGYRISKAGDGLIKGLKTLDAEAVDLAPNVVTLIPSSPLNAIQLARIIDKAEAGMYVDSWFDVNDLPWLIEHTSITRLLIGRQKDKGPKDAEISAVLSTFADRRIIEVRREKSKKLHDRAIVHADGALTQIGTSINGMKNSVTTLVTHKKKDSLEYSEQLENFWRGAIPINPGMPATLAADKKSD